MSLQFRRAVEDMDVWSASAGGFSFVITFASPNGPGFHGRAGFLASWRPLYSRTGAVKVIGSPFKTLPEAHDACNAMLRELLRSSARIPEGPSFGHLVRRTAPSIIGEFHKRATLVRSEGSVAPT
jgi:hypothetical protein